MADQLYEHPRLARVYDPLDPDRSDLDAYVALAERWDARTVLDVGCGTGTLAAVLRERGIEVLGVDPAAASVDVARGKVDGVTWVVGTAEDVASDEANHARVDLATMTANVAQVFVDDADWTATLAAIRTCLRPGGHLAFETRDPADRGWERWTEAQTRRVVDVDGEGPVEEWVQVTRVDGELVTFESPTVFHVDGERLDSTTTLRFRSRDALLESLGRVGFEGVEVAPLPYAPTRGWLVTATATA